MDSTLLTSAASAATLEPPAPAAAAALPPGRIVRLAPSGGLDRLQYSHGAPRWPGPGEVLVRVMAASLNYHDLAVVSGRLPVAEGRIPLSDAAGEVVAVGPMLPQAGVGDPGDAPLQPGDRVMSVFFPRWATGPVSREATQGVPGDEVDGYACDYATVPAWALTRQPRGWSHAEAATLPCAALTAWKALMVDGPLLPGQTVVVQGSGGVSVFALQLAKAAGATVIATSSSDDKLARLRALGADQLIHYRREPEWGCRVLELTGGVGADHVVEVGGAGTLAQSLRACRVGGHVALIGVLSGHAGPVPTALLMARNIRLQGVTVGSRHHQLDLVRALEANALRPVIDRHFPLQALAAALEHQQAARHLGKIVIDLAPASGAQP